MAKMTFFHWAKKEYTTEKDGKKYFQDSKDGEFVRRIVTDRNFPWYNSKNKKDLTKVYPGIVTEHLLKNGCTAEEMIIFVTLYRRYVEEYLGKPYFTEKEDEE